MIDLKQMREIINRNCKPAKNSIFSFEIDIKKLEEELNACSDLHVIAATNHYGTTVNSRIPNVKDLPILTEFISQKGQLEEIMSDQHEIIILTLYSDKEGSYIIRDRGREVPQDELFERLNGCNAKEFNPEIKYEYDLKLICRLLSTLPSYRILITKKFVPKKDKLIYSIRIRYNKCVVEYLNNNKSSIDTSDEDLVEMEEEPSITISTGTDESGIEYINIENN